MATMTEIAKRAGVSQTTVSRVVNNHPGVSSETVEQVRRVLEHADYRPRRQRLDPPVSEEDDRAEAQRPLAPLLILGAQDESSGHITSSGLFASLLRGVSESLQQHAREFSLNFVPGGAPMPGFLHQNDDIEGMLVLGTPTGPQQEQVLRQYPCVWVLTNRTSTLWGDTVQPDNEAIGRMAAEHLVARGCRQLAFINLDRQHQAFQARFHSFELAAREAGVKARPAFRVKHPTDQLWPPLDRDAAAGLVSQLAASDPPPDGVFFANDAQAAVLMPLLQQHGLGDLVALSCDNEPALLAGLQRPLPSINIQPQAIGRRAVEQLIWRARHRDQPGQVRVLVGPLAPALEAPEATEGGEVRGDAPLVDDAPR